MSVEQFVRLIAMLQRDGSGGAAGVAAVVGQGLWGPAC